MPTSSGASSRIARGHQGWGESGTWGGVKSPPRKDAPAAGGAASPPAAAAGGSGNGAAAAFATPPHTDDRACSSDVAGTAADHGSAAQRHRSGERWKAAAAKAVSHPSDTGDANANGKGKPVGKTSPTMEDGMMSSALRKFIFPLCDGCNQVRRRSFIKALTDLGLHRSDLRLQRLFAELDEHGENIPFEDMVEIAGHGGQTVFDAFSGEMIIPRFGEFREECKRIFDETAKSTEGSVSQWIPQLARVNPDLFAVSVMTVDGQSFSFGDSRERFSLQSVSKPISYCMACQEHGSDYVHRYVGREPSGLSGRAIKLKAVPESEQVREPGAHRTTAVPYNPLVNAGAIVCCSMMSSGNSMADRMDQYLGTCSALCGRKVGFDPAVMVSERAVSDRNTALAFTCKGSGAFADPDVDLQETLELYYTTCAVTATAPMVATAAATLANGGVNPLTGEQVFDSEVCRATLSLMLSCGMYDSSGEWAFDIGLPAKSSISGVLMVVVPNVMGMCVYSPRLSDRNLPAKGVDFTKRLVETFAFHHLDSVGGSSSKKTPTLKEHMTDAEMIFAMICASAAGDVMALQQLISAGGNVNQGDYDKRTPLHLAASEGHLEAVEYLLAQGADATVKDRFGHTPWDDAMRGSAAALAAGAAAIGGFGSGGDDDADSFGRPSSSQGQSVFQEIADLLTEHGGALASPSGAEAPAEGGAE